MNEIKTPDNSILENLNNSEKSPSIIDDQDVQELIKSRNIQPEDYSIIESLSRFTKTELISNFHNLFLNLKDRSVEELELAIRNYEKKLDNDINNDDLRRVKEMSEWYLEVCRKYDYFTAHHLNRVLERLNTHSEFSTKSE